MKESEKVLVRMIRDRRPALLISEGGAAERLALSYLRPCDVHLHGAFDGRMVGEGVDMCWNATLFLNLNLLSDDVAFNRIKVLMDARVRPCGMVIAYLNLEHTNLLNLPGQAKTPRDTHLVTIMAHSMVISADR